MSHLSSQRKDGVLIVQLTLEKILDDALILQVGWELMTLAEQANGKMLLDFDGVRLITTWVNQPERVSLRRSSLAGSNPPIFPPMETTP